MPHEEIFPKLRTTNALARLLSEPGFPADLDSIDAISMIRSEDQARRYEKKEKEIPELISEMLRERSSLRTRLVGRRYIEDDAWLVQVECGEGEKLYDIGHEILTRSRGGSIVPALVEGATASAHYVKIRVPEIFVRTLALPMVACHLS